MNDRKPWQVSSYTGGNGNCVEVSKGKPVLVRDTKDREGGMLGFAPNAWDLFLGKIK